MTEVSPWKAELARSFREPGPLAEFLQLDPFDFSGKSEHSLLVPRPYAKRMEKGNAQDPLLRQVLVSKEEGLDIPGFEKDPLAESASLSNHCLIQKYWGRILALASPACAVHCRYCFRRHLNENSSFDTLLHELKNLPANIPEIILSGGDPLMLDNGQLAKLFEALSRRSHIPVLRIHSRLPIVIPSRIDDPLCSLLAEYPAAKILVIHSNHPAELDESTCRAFSALEKSGVKLFNQSVLLRGVNDSAELLAEFCQKLFSQGVLPYYLHQLDRVQGATHFEVSTKKGRKITEKLRKLLPGYLVPRYVQEIAGEASKRPL